MRYFLIALLINIPLLGNAQLGTQIDSLSVLEQKDSAFNLISIHHKNAVALISKLLTDSRALNSSYVLQEVLYTSAYADWFNGDHKTALEKSKESLLYATRLKDNLKIAKNYSLIGLIYLYTADYDSSLTNFKKAQNEYVLLKDTARIIKNYGFEALVYNKQGDYVKSKENLLKTVLIKRSFSTQNWSIINIEESKEISTRYYQESLINAKQDLVKLGNNPGHSMTLRQTYLNLGLAYLRLDFGDSSLAYFKKSADVSRVLGIDVLWLEYARAYKKLELYDSAIICNNKAIVVSLNRGTRITLGMAYNQMGDAYKGLKEFQKAKGNYKKALALHAYMGHKNAQMNILLNVSDMDIELNQLEEAFSYADSSLTIAQTIGSRYGRVEALKTIYTIDKLQGHYKKAFEVKQIHDILLDSLKKGEVQLSLAKLDLYNEVELSKVEINDLNKQQALSRANLYNRTLVMVIVIIVSTFIVLILIFNYRRSQKIRSFNDELNQQQEVIRSKNLELSESNREKEILLGEIHHRVKNNLQTISSLLSIQQRKLKDPESVKVLEDSKNRVQAMGLIHQHIYQDSNFGEIDFKNYTKELIANLISANACCPIEVKCAIPDLSIDLDNAVFFGLIINELAINSIKHAYEDVENPLLTISIFEEKGMTALQVSDNGKERNINFDKSESFGWKMVNTIATKLDAEIIIDNSAGLSVKILFSKDLLTVKPT